MPLIDLSVAVDHVALGLVVEGAISLKQISQSRGRYNLRHHRSHSARVRSGAQIAQDGPRGCFTVTFSRVSLAVSLAGILAGLKNGLFGRINVTETP